MADCMECDADIDWGVDKCPNCGLDFPVARKWYVEGYEPRFNELRASGQLKLLAKEMWHAHWEACSLPDPVMIGELRRSLESLYREIQFDEALIVLLVEDATDPNFFFCIENPGRKAYLHAVEIGREDLELYVMNTFDGFNKNGPPADLVQRKAELLAKEKAGELAEFESPGLDGDIWDDHPFWDTD